MSERKQVQTYAVGLNGALGKSEPGQGSWVYIADYNSLAQENERLSAMLEAIWARCHIVYWPENGSYPLEHTMRANKSSRQWIERDLWQGILKGDEEKKAGAK